MLRDIRELAGDPEAYAAELNRRWGGLLSYRYLGRSYSSMDIGATDTVPVRHDMRNPTGGLYLAVLGIVSPDSGLVSDLEAVPNPHPGTLYLVRFTCPEFTSLCPITGQPDFAEFIIDYVPKDWILDKVPVLPPAFRPVSMMGDSGTPLVNDANYLYKELLDSVDNHRRMKDHLGDDDEWMWVKGFANETGRQRHERDRDRREPRPPGRGLCHRPRQFRDALCLRQARAGQDRARGPGGPPPSGT